MNSKPKIIRIILLVQIIVILLVSIGGFIIGYTWLSSEAKLTNDVIVRSSVSTMNPQALAKLKSDLDNLSPTLAKIDAMTVPASDFQKTAIDDVTAYAKISNLGKVNFDFESSSASTNVPSTSFSKKQFSISLADTVSYTSFIQFIKLIENNLPKMEVESFTAGAGPDDSKDKVIIKDLKINMYTR